MSMLRDAIDDYLQLRRSLGFTLTQAAQWLQDFATFMEQQQASLITTELALQWARRPSRAQPSTWAKRLMVLRQFARFHQTTEPRTEVPPDGLLPHQPKRAKPYLYTDEEIVCLMQAAASFEGLRGRSYACLFGLLAVTGLRISEALALKQANVDLQQGVLTICKTKFGKSRLVPLHPSTQAALLVYAQYRDDRLRGIITEHFFSSLKGRPLNASTVRYTFRRLCRQIGLHGSPASDQPKLHHFRHRFATQTLVQWSQASANIEQQLPILSTFLGHSRVADTYWYLSAHPELIRQAVKQLEHRWEITS